jgi:hypothetical protein
VAESYVPPKHLREIRTLFRHRVAIVKIRTMVKNEVRALLDKHGFACITARVVTVAIGGNDDIRGANKTDFYFPGVLTKATLTIDGNTIVQNGKLTA